MDTELALWYAYCCFRDGLGPHSTSKYPLLIGFLLQIIEIEISKLSLTSLRLKSPWWDTDANMRIWLPLNELSRLLDSPCMLLPESIDLNALIAKIERYIGTFTAWKAICASVQECTVMGIQAEHNVKPPIYSMKIHNLWCRIKNPIPARRPHLLHPYGDREKAAWTKWMENDGSSPGQITQKMSATALMLYVAERSAYQRARSEFARGTITIRPQKKDQRSKFAAATGEDYSGYKLEKTLETSPRVPYFQGLAKPYDNNEVPTLEYLNFALRGYQALPARSEDLDYPVIRVTKVRRV